MTVELNAHGALLRPIEARVRRLSADGVPTEEIARRFRRMPETIERVRAMSELRQVDARPPFHGDVLTPRQRRVLQWRAERVSHADIAAMFKRSERFIRQVEHLAHHRLGSP